MWWPWRQIGLINENAVFVISKVDIWFCSLLHVLLSGVLHAILSPYFMKNIKARKYSGEKL